MQLRTRHRSTTRNHRARLAIHQFQRPHPHQRRTARSRPQHAVRKRIHFAKRPDVPVIQIHSQRKRAHVLRHQRIRPPITVRRIGEIVRPIQKQHRTPNPASRRRRIKPAQPPLPRCIIQCRQTPVPPETVMPQKSAAVHRHRHLELRIQPRAQTRQISSPADPRDSRPLRVGFRQRSHQRMPPQHRRNRMPRPHVRSLPIAEHPELHVITLTRPARLVCLPVRSLPGRVHRQRHITPLRPVLRPIRKRPPSPAMHQHHRRCLSTPRRRTAQPPEHPRRLPPQRNALIPHLLQQSVAAPVTRSRRRLRQRRHKSLQRNLIRRRNDRGTQQQT